MKSGQTTIAAAGTAVQLTDYKGNYVVIRWLSGTGACYVGDKAVSATAGLPIDSTHPEVTLRVSDSSDIWVDAATNGNKVAWVVAPGVY